MSADNDEWKCMMCHAFTTDEEDHLDLFVGTECGKVGGESLISHSACLPCWQGAYSRKKVFGSGDPLLCHGGREPVRELRKLSQPHELDSSKSDAFEVINLDNWYSGLPDGDMEARQRIWQDFSARLGTRYKQAAKEKRSLQHWAKLHSALILGEEDSRSAAVTEYSNPLKACANLLHTSMGMYTDWDLAETYRVMEFDPGHIGIERLSERNSQEEMLIFGLKSVLSPDEYAHLATKTLSSSRQVVSNLLSRTHRSNSSTEETELCLEVTQSALDYLRDKRENLKSCSISTLASKLSIAPYRKIFPDPSRTIEQEILRRSEQESDALQEYDNVRQSLRRRDLSAEEYQSMVDSIQ